MLPSPVAPQVAMCCEPAVDRGPETSLSMYLATHPEATCVIGIHGKWYDVTSFRHRHPGGALLLEKCHGKDASELFKAFHARDVLRGWRCVGTFSQTCHKNKIAEIFNQLADELKHEGFFETSYTWYCAKFLATFTLLGTAMLILYRWYGTTTAARGAQQQPVWPAALAGLCLGLFWQQCGFLMHDLMHAELTHRPWVDRWIGHFVGSLCLGISAHWWRDEHFEHHAFCNVIDPKTLYVDPQMQEDVWVQDAALFPLYEQRSSALVQWLQLQAIRYQHMIWIPLCVVAGRVAIIVNGLYKERRWYELCAQAVHTLGMIVLLKMLIPHEGGQRLRLLTYAIASLYEGVLHMQLLVSHYAKPWIAMDDLLTNVSWYEQQVRSNMNVKNPWWLDWFHGGLNFHIEHHLYPLMPRHNFRKASQRVREACEKANLPYDECCLSEAIWRTLCRLHEVATLYVARSTGPLTKKSA